MFRLLTCACVAGVLCFCGVLHVQRMVTEGHMSRLLSEHSAVGVVLEMLKNNHSLSIQEDCLDALAELVRWSEQSCADLVQHNGIQVLLGMRKSASIRGRLQAISVLSLLLLNPKKFNYCEDIDFITDEILLGLCAFVDQPTTLANSASTEEVSFQAATLIRRLTELSSSKGLIWECLRPSFAARPQSGERSRGRSTADTMAGTEPSAGVSEGKQSAVECGAQGLDCDSSTWRAIEDVPVHKRWLSESHKGAAAVQEEHTAAEKNTGGPQHNNGDGRRASSSMAQGTADDAFNYLVKLLTDGENFSAEAMEAALHDPTAALLEQKPHPAQHGMREVVKLARQVSQCAETFKAGIKKAEHHSAPAQAGRTSAHLRSSEHVTSLSPSTIAELPSAQLEHLSTAQRQRLQDTFASPQRWCDVTRRPSAVSARVKCEMLLTIRQMLIKSHGEEHFDESQHGGGSGAGLSIDREAADRAVEFMVMHTHLPAVLAHLINPQAAQPGGPLPVRDGAASAWELELQVLAFECLKHLAQAICTRSVDPCWRMVLPDAQLLLTEELMQKKKKVRPFLWMTNVQIQLLAKRLSCISLKASDVVVSQGKFSRIMYVVLSGTLDVSCTTKGLPLYHACHSRHTTHV